MAKPRLDWIPLFIHRIKGSARWKAMNDFERGWYISLLIESADSERMGYLPITDKLYLSAGARSRSFFEQKFWTGLVGACFTRSEFGGREWIHNPTLLHVIETQLSKLKSGGGLPSSLSSKGSIKDLEEADSLINVLFSFYCNLFKRDPRYKLTPERRQKCKLRLIEYMGDNEASLSEAVEATKESMRRLAGSGFHVNGGWYDWTDHIFGSRDKFQKRLTATYSNGKPQVVTMSAPKSATDILKEMEGGTYGD